MESESPSIDPRYRPEFQRGYIGTTAPIPLAPTSPADAPIRVELPPVDVLTPDVPVTDVPVTDVPVTDVPVTDVPPIAGEPVRRRRNPYIALIVVTGITSIGIGTWLIVRQSLVDFASNGFSSSSESYRFAQALAFTFSGPLITIGFAALLGVGFFVAARRL